MSRLLLPVALAAVVCASASAAPAPPTPGEAAPQQNTPGLTFPHFLSQVGQGNLDLVAQRQGVPLAEAQVAVAKIFPDPTVSAGLASIDVSGQGQPTSVTVQLGATVELGGKRGARVAAAQADVGVAQAQLEEYLRGLRGGAAAAFIDALRAREALRVQRHTQESLEALVRLNQERLRAGDVGEVALLQARVEARRHQSEVLQAEADLSTTSLGLERLLGRERALAGRGVQGELRQPPRTFDDAALLASARERRPDLLALRRGLQAAEARVRLARANRYVDVGVNAGWTHNFATRAEAFAQPDNDVLNATLSVPLGLSRVFRGELRGAEAARQQKEAEGQALALQVEIELRQALTRYRAAAARVALYDQGLLRDAERVQQATLFTYQKGGATLLEVLVAQRTLDELRLSYYDALADHARALVAVELAAGLWDIAL